MIARTLHRLTSYEPSREWTDPIDDPRIVQDLEVNDFATIPWFFKRYDPDLPRIPLSRDLPACPASTLSVLAGDAAVAPAPLTLEHLSRILYLSAGVVRTMTRSWGTMPFRAAGSAGGRFPLEVYASLPDGVHWYDPADHALVRVAPPATGGGPAVIVTGIPWRTGWRYRERGYRHIYWDLGTMLSQLLAAASSAGVSPTLYSRFPDEEVAALVGADGVHEFPVAVVALGETTPALTPAGPAAPGEVDAKPLEFPLITDVYRAAGSSQLGAPWPAGAPVSMSPNSAVAASVEEVALARGSQRRMDATRGLPASLLHTSMTVALRGTDLPQYVAVHDVAGVAPGLYRWPDMDTVLRPGNLREELCRVSLGQELSRDAAFVVITAADMTTLDDIGYREAQLAAGLVEGRLHLLAYALGASATGMTFIDSEIPDLLGAPLEAMLFTCVGVPDYRSVRGGRPGEPAALKGVRPR